MHEFSTPNGDDGASCSTMTLTAEKSASANRARPPAYHMSPWLALWLLAVSSPLNLCAQTTNRTLSWLPNPSTESVTNYKVFQAAPGSAFGLWATTATTSAPVVVSLTQPVRFYVTALNAGGESAPSATVTNFPPQGGPVISILAPSLSRTNLLIGETVNVTATMQNSGDADFTAVDGALTLLAPGATRADGPYIYIAILPVPWVVSARGGRSISGSWTAPVGAQLGQWNTYLVVQDANGTWTAGPSSFFNVNQQATNPPPTAPSAPTGLKFSATGTTSGILSWMSDATARTEVEESRDQNAFQRVATVAAGTHGYSRTNLRRGRDYAWRVRATKNGLVSGYSNVAVR